MSNKTHTETYTVQATVSMDAKAALRKEQGRRLQQDPSGKKISIVAIAAEWIEERARMSA